MRCRGALDNVTPPTGFISYLLQKAKLSERQKEINNIAAKTYFVVFKKPGRHDRY